MHRKVSFCPWLCLILLLFAAPLHADWVKDGVGICINPAAFQSYHKIVSDGEGGAFIAFYSLESGQFHFVQRVDAFGRPLWDSNGIKVCPSSNLNLTPIAMASDGAGGVIIAWRDGRTPEGIYAQRMDASGNLLWAPAGVAVCTASGNQENPVIAADGSGGAYIAWQDIRSGNYDIYAQRLNSSGSALWTANGVAVCAAANEQSDVQIVADFLGLYLTWKDYRAGAWDIYAQWLSPSAMVMWAANGAAICTATGAQGSPVLAATGFSGATIAWLDYSLPTIEIYMQQIAGAGVVQWAVNGISVSSLPGDKKDARIVSDGTAGGSMVVWSQAAGGAYDIYAQRFNYYGAAQWTAGGVAVCTATGAQEYPDIACDADGNLLVTWSDWRIGSATDIYAQKLNSSGAQIWAANGAPVCTAALGQSGRQIVSDGARGAIVTWGDSRSGGNPATYVQRIEENGYWGYPAPDIFRLRDVPGDQGGQVSLAWYGSRLDLVPGAVVSEYTLWRAINWTEAALAVKSGARMLKDVSELEAVPGARAIRTQALGGKTYFWELVSTLDAYRLTSYSKTVETLFDSTAACTDRNYFQVIAHTGDVNVFWISEPDSVRSVDNLSPAPPVGLAGEQSYTPAGLELSWRPNGESDLGEYVIYRGTSAEFVPGPGNFVGSTPDTLYLDGMWSWSDEYYYKVAAIDIHGNVSGFALLAPDNLTGDETPRAPAASFLAQNFPNPFNPTTKISFGLAAPADVSLRIYDAAGRLVRVLIEGARPAGNYSELWDGRDSNGRAVASGIYFYRLQAGAFSETRKMALLR